MTEAVPLTVVAIPVRTHTKKKLVKHIYIILFLIIYTPVPGGIYIYILHVECIFID